MQPEQDQNYWQPSADAAPSTPVESEIAPATTDAPEPTLNTIAEPITWQASEFVHHEKSGQWFLALFGVAIVILVIDILLVHSWSFGVLIVVMAISAATVARRPPRILNYSLSNQGIAIDQKQFSFHDFRAFGVIEEGAFYSIRLIPIKRFMPMVSVYFPTEHGEQIVDLFGSVLPMERIEPDAIDKLVEKIRF